jgi:hypothetical protein
MNKLIELALAASILLAVGCATTQHYRGDGERAQRISSVIADCERRTDEFKVSFAHALEHSRLDGTRREDQLNRDARRLETAMDRLRQSWNREHDWDRSRYQVGVAIAAAQDIHRTLSRHSLRSYVENQWHTLRRELDRLAEVFDQPKVEWVNW